MAQRSTYWSCTPFADWIRGIKKGGAKTGRGWDEWEKEAKTKYPIRYWIAEEALDAVQNFIWWPIDQIYNLKYYINNRWVSRTHSLTAHRRDIAPGTWCDVGNRFLPCLFNELVDYVEIELAWWHIAWDDEAKKKYQAPFWARGWFRWRTWRCPEAGLDNLKWQSELVWKDHECEPGSPNVGQPTHQAKNAQEILALYKWWTEVYRNRPDPHDASGWTEYCERKRQLNPGHMGLFNDAGETKELREFANRALDLTQKIEEQYRQEDEEMMIRLIKVRDALWT